MFLVILAAFSSLGHLLFVSMSTTFCDLWSSMFGVTALLSGRMFRTQGTNQGQIIATNVYMFMAMVFGYGLLTSYVSFCSGFFQSQYFILHNTGLCIPVFPTEETNVSTRRGM